MSTALAGFLGIIAGGLLTGAIQTATSWIDRRRGGRVAARLLYMHLWWARDAVAAAYTEKYWNPDIGWDLFAATWQEQREPLAVVMNTPHFLAVASAFNAIDQLALIRNNDIKSGHEHDVPSGSPQPSVFTASPDYRTGYEANLHYAMLVVHTASFTWYERRKSVYKTGLAEVKAKTSASPPVPTAEDVAQVLRDAYSGKPVPPPSGATHGASASSSHLADEPASVDSAE
jgi:hypothetical protein